MKRLISVFFLILILASCNEDELTNSIIKDDTTPMSEVDKWVNANFTSPYNIEVKYKWDDKETDLDKNLTPPQEDKVTPFLDVLKSLWIDTYVQEAGADFFKTLSPKQVLLIGSSNMNSDGSSTEGTAEGGRKIILYNVNSFDVSDTAEVKQMIHVVHHEFAHIMHQTKNFTTEFNEITPEGYTVAWTNYDLETARSLGFITRYARQSTNEDFVEMIATILTHSHEEWEAILAAVEDPVALEALRKKEAIVADYFRMSWGIDIYSFQELVSSEIDRLLSNL